MPTPHRTLTLIILLTLPLRAFGGGGGATSPSPTLVAPAANAFIGNNTTLSYILPTAPFSGSKTLTFSNGVNLPTVLTLSDSTASVYPATFTNPLVLTNPTVTDTASVLSVTGPPISSGTYNVTFSYRDAAGDNAAAVTSSNVLVELATPSPTLVSPATSASIGNHTTLTYTLRTAATSGSKTLVFYNGVAAPTILTLSDSTASTYPATFSYPFTLTNPILTDTASVFSVTGPALTSGTYSVTFSYQDAAGNPAASVTSSNVLIETAAPPPTLISPSAGYSSNPIHVNYYLPTAVSGSLQLLFVSSSGTDTLVIQSGYGSAGQHTFNFNPASPLSSLPHAIVGGNPLADGTYTSVTLAYTDTLGNPASTSLTQPFIIDTVPPVITPPVGGFSPLIIFAGDPAADYADQAIITDLSPTTIGQSPIPGVEMDTVGDQTITITGTDAAGNTASYPLTISVRPDYPITTTVVSTNILAPGAGSGGLDPVAVGKYYYEPAIDDAGNLAIAFKYYGHSSHTHGTAMVLNTKCLGLTGGPVPGISGATFSSFTNPVVDAGNIIWISSIHTPSPASVVMSNLGLSATSASVIARSGTLAPDSTGLTTAGGPIFRTFDSVAVRGTSAAILATLTGGTGAAKITSANNTGIWIKDGVGPLDLALRSGNVIGSATISKLIAFAPGNGSPGQGRGWLTLSSSVPTVLALAILSDKSQAIIQSTPLGGPVILSRTGVTGGPTAPSISGASFAAFGIPAAIDSGSSAFLARLTVGAAGVTKANATGIFLSGAGGYTPLARVGDKAPGVSGTFTLLKDPILAPDGGVAFLATVTGTAFKGISSSTLWYQPPGGSLALIAQGGAAPGNDIPGVQLSAFKSLAIAPGRGPIFIATLALGHGVIPSNDTALWACDFTGSPRLLARTGEGISFPGDTTSLIRSFTLLNSSPGTPGVTHSFNNNATVAWIANFTDGTQSLIQSEVP